MAEVWSSADGSASVTVEVVDGRVSVSYPVLAALLGVLGWSRND